MRLSLFLFCFLFIGLTIGQSQKILQLEKYGSLKNQRYYIGEQISYQLKDDDTWYRETINDLLIEENIILFANRAVRLEDIAAIKRIDNRAWSKGMGLKLYVFGASWAFFSLVGTIWLPLTWAALIVPAVSFTVGFILQKVFKTKTIKLGKKRWLRMLDITMPTKADFL